MKTILTILLIALSVSGYSQRPILKMLFENNAVDSSMYSVDGGTSGSVAYSSTYKAQGGYSFYPGWLGQWESTGNFNTGAAFYVSAWIRTATNEDNKTIIGNYPKGGSDGWYLAINGGTNSVYFHTVGGGILNSVITGTNVWSNDTWTNIGLWVDRANSKARIYINGIKQTLASNDSTIRSDFPYNTTPISVNGYLDGGQSFNTNGYIDNVQVYNYLLNQSQIDSLVARVNDVPAFELGRAEGSVPSVYSPVAGRDVWFTYNGVDQIPSHNGLDKYPHRKGSGIIADTIQYYLSEDFESWTTATVQNKDSMDNRLPMSWFNHIPSDNSIVDVSGDNMWRVYIQEDARQGFQNYIHLGDTATELYYQMELCLETGFNQVAKNGIGSGKLPGGLFSGNAIYNLETANPDDTSTIYGYSIGGRVHNVWGQTPNMMIYKMDQDNYPYPLALGSWGVWPMPIGTCQTKTIRVNVGTPGNHDGFAEVFVDGVLEAQVTGMKFRSLSQGDDFGKLEGVYNSYQFGGGPGYLCPQDQYMQWDDLLVYRLNSNAVGYVSGPSDPGRVLPTVDLPSSELVPDYRLADEIYTESRDTIYDVGNNVHYIYNPPNKHTPIYKTVAVPDGGISFKFLVEEFGWSPGASSTYVKVYAGTKDDDLLYTFGIASGQVNPTDGYYYHINEADIANGVVTFEIYIGYSNYDTRGIAIVYIRD